MDCQRVPNVCSALTCMTLVLGTTPRNPWLHNCMSEMWVCMKISVDVTQQIWANSQLQDVTSCRHIFLLPKTSFQTQNYCLNTLQCTRTQTWGEYGHFNELQQLPLCCDQREQHPRVHVPPAPLPLVEQRLELPLPLQQAGVGSLPEPLQLTSSFAPSRDWRRRCSAYAWCPTSFCLQGWQPRPCLEEPAGVQQAPTLV